MVSPRVVNAIVRRFAVWACGYDWAEPFFSWGRFGIIETREDLFRLKKVKSILERKKKKAKEKKMAAAREKLV